MLRPVPMAHMRIQVPNRDAAAVTRCIAREGLLHLVDIAHGRIAADAAPPETVDLLPMFRDLAHRIERVCERLGVPLPELVGSLEESESGDLATERALLEAKLAPVEAAVTASWRARSEAADRAGRASQALERAERLAAAGVDLRRVTAARYVHLRLGEAPYAELSALAAQLAPVAFTVIPLESSPAPLAAVAVPFSQQARLEGALRVAAFAETPLPEDPSEWEPARLAAERAKSEEEVRRIDEEIRARRAEWTGALPELARRARTAVLLLQAQSHFVAAGRFVVISGWVPKDAADRMRRAVVERSGGRAVVEVERPEDLPEVFSGALKVPILHRNPILLRPFQRLVNLYGTPAYEEVEPTAFFAVSFLLMFGLMFGDLGHGLVLFLAGHLLFRHAPRYLDYGILLMEGGVSSALFGLLYGSFFGIEGLLPVLWMEPLRESGRFLPVAIGLGLFLVSAGLVINVINTWRAGERGAALFGSRGLLGAFGFWVTAAVVARLFVGERWRISGWWIAFLLAVPALLLVLRRPIVERLDRGRPARRRGREAPPLLAALEGSVELVDAIVSYFANTISFLRVAAFAMVHAGAFLALFAVADAVSGARGGGVLSLLVLIAGNAVMILLEGLTVSVQVLRLEYYEFFGKFFRGGGEPYRPLMLRAAPASKGAIS